MELNDSTGLLSATVGDDRRRHDRPDHPGVSLTTLNSDLASLRDTNGRAGPDNITVNVSDSFGNIATQTIDVTVAAAPAIAAASAQTIGVGQAATGSPSAPWRKWRRQLARPSRWS